MDSKSIDASIAAQNKAEREDNAIRCDFLDLVYDLKSDYPVHPEAGDYRLMTNSAWAAFVHSIETTRLIHDRVVIDQNGQLIDGRNRIMAFRELREKGVEVNMRVEIKRFNDKKSVSAFIRSKNVHRRHLTKSEYADKMKSEATVKAKGRTKRQEQHRKVVAKGRSKDDHMSVISPTCDHSEPLFTITSQVGELSGKKSWAASKLVGAAVERLGIEKHSRGRYTQDNCNAILDEVVKIIEENNTTKAVPKKTTIKKPTDELKSQSFAAIKRTVEDHVGRFGDEGVLPAVKEVIKGMSQ